MPKLYFEKPSQRISKYLIISSLISTVILILSTLLCMRFGAEETILFKGLRTRNVNISKPQCILLSGGYACDANISSTSLRDAPLSSYTTNIVSFVVRTESASGKLTYVPRDLQIISFVVLVTNGVLFTYPSLHKSWFYRRK